MNSIRFQVCKAKLKATRFLAELLPALEPAQVRVTPMWGFGTVAASLHPLIPVGEKLDGYSSVGNSVHLVRGSLSSGHLFMRCAADPSYTARRTAIHHHCRQLKFSSSIGATPVKEMGGAKVRSGPKATLFFAPAQIKKRSAQWGSQGLVQRMVHSWQVFIAPIQEPAQPWLRVTHHQGHAAVQEAYARVLAGSGDPRTGHMLSL